MRNTLVILAKAPRVGQVKTRLSASIGPVEAARFYRAVSTAVISRLGSDPRWRTMIAVTPDSFLQSHIWPQNLERVGQGRGDLGVRMQRLFDVVSETSTTPGSTLIIGTDIPSVTPRHIAHAFKILGDNNVVFGPAEDGGFWLVGCRHVFRPSRLFANVRWSTRHALADTRANAAGYRVGICDTLGDIDDRADYLSWRSRAPRRFYSRPCGLCEPSTPCGAGGVR
ncbi:MAG: TIGR04282 family arsenosugar biosynthesis glycosyltransferase [Fimbriimonadaceae bacterium]|nr:TIGR04282 family arsenosugar biosynthesis glycosyltransferase [Alphaproteobacteria bacterium]